MFQYNWLVMTIRHMILFRTVCENGYNSTKAAEVLHMTQPAVSLAIKELEQYYGVRLFDRIGRRLQITEAGQHFLQYAIHISDLFSDMETGLRDWDSKGINGLGISVLPLSVDITKFKCDAYDYEKWDAVAVNSFHGEYMVNYSWAEFTTGRYIHMEMEHRK